MLLVLCGTNRAEANTRKVATNIENLLRARTDQEVRLLDLANLKQDIFDPACYGDKPDWFEDEFQQPVLNAKGMVVVTPEYNGSFPGVLKYFIDMLRFPESLVGLPVALVGCAAGQFGALRSVEQLEIIMHYRKVHLFGERLFIPHINDALEDNGTLKDTYQSRLEGLLEGFLSFLPKLNE